jgi:hypothetical protein
MTAARSFITARRRSKALLTPPAASCTASLRHTGHASLRRGKRGPKLVWVIGNPGHNPARVTHSFPGRSFLFYCSKQSRVMTGAQSKELIGRIGDLGIRSAVSVPAFQSADRDRGQLFGQQKLFFAPFIFPRSNALGLFLRRYECAEPPDISLIRGLCAAEQYIYPIDGLSHIAHTPLQR